MMIESIIIVNEQDENIGAQEKLLVHQQGLLHRAFSVFIVNNQSEILLQQRQFDKYHSGGLWTNTCCGHPNPNETISEAAKRRLYEEMGLMLELREIGVFHYTAKFENGLIENEIDHVLIGKFDDQAIKPNPAEIANYRWTTLDALKKDLTDHPEKYTPWFKQAFEILLSRLN